MIKFISELPKEIMSVALQRQRECKTQEHYSKTTDNLRQAFVWEHTDEKAMVWSDVNQGRYESFYNFHGINHNIRVSERYKPLFSLMSIKHGVTLSVSDMDELARACEALYRSRIEVINNNISLSVSETQNNSKQ
jgi:hypothetical protein